MLKWKRRERKDSIIFCGVMATNLTEARNIIATPSEHLLGTQPPILPVLITGEKNFRKSRA